MRKVLFSAFILSFFLLSFTSKVDWTLYKSVDGVNIYSRTQTAPEGSESDNVILFKYVNTNNFAVTVQWKLNLYFNGNCRGCSLPSPNEYELSLDLAPNQSVEGVYSSDGHALKIFHSSQNPKITPLERFEFEGLKVIRK